MNRIRNNKRNKNLTRNKDQKKGSGTRIRNKVRNNDQEQGSETRIRKSNLCRIIKEIRNRGRINN